MPGHMGTTRTTVQNLKVVAVRPEDNVILVSGAVPGHQGQLRHRPRRQEEDRLIIQGISLNSQRFQVMSAKSLTAEDAQAANLVLVGPDKGRQAVHDLVTAYRANRRSGTANTKTRGEVSGNNKKIYKQKGTGNARHGDKRAPIFVGGGVVFGPRPRDYSKKVPKTVRKLALRRALGDLDPRRRRSRSSIPSPSPTARPSPSSPP